MVGDQIGPGPDDYLEPGNYSVFVLRDDETWCQPTYYVNRRMTEDEFMQIAIREHGGFIAYGVQADDDCPKEYVRKLPK